MNLYGFKSQIIILFLYILFIRVRSPPTQGLLAKGILGAGVSAGTRREPRQNPEVELPGQLPAKAVKHGPGSTQERPRTYLQH